MATRFSILCVDDQPAVLMTQAEVLRRDGFTVYTAASLTEARAVLAGKRIDGVVLDASVCETEQVCMYEATRDIQPKLTVVLHTGNPEAMRQNCVQDKPTIAKPVPPAELASRLRQIRESGAEG